MFLDEMSGKLSFNNIDKALVVNGKELQSDMKFRRLYAAPDTIDGQLYIDAFINLDDINDLDALKELGVMVQCSFKCGILTASIPADRILEVAALDNVKGIEVSPLMVPTTDEARRLTHIDDVLTLSAEAVRQGLTSPYDGTGVLLGIVDDGIDFQHIAFKNADGSSRICRAYVYNGSGEHIYTSVSADNGPTTDDNTEDHGTHTASTAGGSSVIINGNDVTVTTNHSQATYGGMAPGASLYLAGVKNLNTNGLINATNYMVEYADSNHMPIVVSNSWGSQIGPHDGTGYMARTYNDLFNDSHPNRIVLFAAGNDAGKSKNDEGGGFHLHGSSSSTNPLGTILRSSAYTDTDGGLVYKGACAYATVCSTNVSNVAVRLLVLDTATGDVLASTTVSPTSSGQAITSLEDYYTGTIIAYFDNVNSSKAEMLIYAENNYVSTNYTCESEYCRSGHTLAIEVYPTNGSTARVDIWGGNSCYLTNHLITTGHNWTAGSDDMCVSDESTIANVISVGAYVSKNRYTNYENTTYVAPSLTMGDIAPFSSYATPDESPTGLRYPWITAPGARLAAGVNHYHTTDVDSYSYYNSRNLVLNSPTSPYAMMQGTSMATPVVAGIVALWLQEANEHGQSLTISDVKEIMSRTAITDSYTDGAYAARFGNGKINSLGYVPPSWQGSGTTQAPYLISNVAELNQLSRLVNDGNEYSGTHFRLTDNITYPHTTLWNDAASTEDNFTAIGHAVSNSEYIAFKGHLNGDGHTVSGIRIYKDGTGLSDCHQGLFGIIEEGSVSGVTLTDTRITGSSMSGGIAGKNNGSTVTDCHVGPTVEIHSVQSATNYHGGIVGSNTGNGTVSLCSSSATLSIAEGCTSCEHYGAIAGNSLGTLRDNLTNGATIPTVRNNHYGAIVGQNNNGVLQRNYYYNCTVAGVTNASNVGCSNADITTNDGAVPVPTVSVGNGSWHAIATPMHDRGSDELAIANTPGLTSGSYDMFYFDEATGIWRNRKQSEGTAAGFNTLGLGQGFIYRRTGGTSIPFVGFANSGTVETAITASCADNNLKGFNLIGNPYPHNISRSNLSGSNLSDGYYALQPNGTWLARTTEEIGIGQAFMVQTNSSGTVTFSETSGGGNTKSSSSTLTITVTCGEFEDAAYVIFGHGEGLRKIAHMNSSAPMLSILQDGTNYAITSTERNIEAIPLSFHSANSGEYTITVSASYSAPYLHLLDLATGADIDLLHQPSYKYTHSDNLSVSERFLVRLTSNGEKPFAYQNSNAIVVAGEGTLQVFDIMGRLLFAKEIPHSGFSIPNTQFPHAGVYLLRLNGKTQKLVIRF